MLVRVVAIVGVIALGLASFGAAARPPSDARAEITGTGTRYVLTVTNTGALPIYCMRFRPAYGVVIVATDGASLFGNTIGTAGPYPGEVSRTRFRTKRPYPLRAGGELTLSNPSFEKTCLFPGRRLRASGPVRRA